VLILFWLGLITNNLAYPDGLTVYSEYQRPGPQGKVVKSDFSVKSPSASPAKSPAAIELEAARNGFVSFHLQVSVSQPGPYSIAVRFEERSPLLQADLFKAWFHGTRKGQELIPDALVPVLNPYSGKIPDPDNQIQGQTSQTFWVDIWVPREARPGVYSGKAILRSGQRRHQLQLRLKVLKAVIPDEDALTIDHNSYGTSWMANLYPRLRETARGDFFRSDELFRLIHAYHCIFYDHRGTFHQLGYGHGGKVGPEFAPELKGRGRNKQIASWELFDRHYAGLLDGSALAASRRGAKPIPFVYLPINPEWPASFLAWGEPGYEAEFVNVVSAMERHFREKGWTETRFEMFFNHKKRYKGFHWDGDEARFAKDDKPILEYGRLLKKSVPPDSPVKFVFRHDVSWRMEEQFKTLAGVVNFWVCSRAILSWLPGELRPVKQRGDIVWIYSGPPAIGESSSAILENPLRAWMWDLDGYIHWLTVSPSRDPWFQSEGESTSLAYPGERFGVFGPIPSIRLKVQRNFAQDLALLKSLERTRGAAELRAEIARRVNGTQPKDWWTPRPAMAELPPEELTNRGIDGGIEPNLHRFQNWDPRYWEPIRKFILSLAEGERTQ
jgi:hypothetical protein